MTAAEKISKARSGLVLDFCFWGLTGLRLSLVNDPSCKTAWTDGKQLGYNSEFVLSLPMAELKGLCGHEIGHCTFLHPLRMADMRRSLGISHLETNICADYAINGILIKAGFHLPKGFLYDQRFDGLSIEEIAKIRKAEREQEQQKTQQQSQETEQGAGQDSKGETDGEEQDSDKGSQDEETGSTKTDGDSPTDEDSETDSKGDNSQDSDSDKSQEGEQGETGSREDQGELESQETEQGEQDSENQEGQDIGNCGECRDAKDEDGEPLSPAEIAEQSQEWSIAVLQAAQQSRAMGEALGDAIDQLVSEIISPLVDYRILLWEFAQRTAKNDYRKSPPNKRHITKGLYLPSLVSEELKCVVIGNDTSGSIDQEKRNQAGAEITAILESFKAHAIVIHCDDRIRDIVEYETDDLPIDLSPKGGYGTDFCPVFEYIEREGLSPDCLIYLTDLEGRFPETEPDYPVLWIDLSKYGASPPFGEVIRA